MLVQGKRHFDIRLIGNHLNYHPGLGCRFDKILNTMTWARSVAETVVAVLAGKVLGLGGFIHTEAALEA